MPNPLSNDKNNERLSDPFDFSLQEKLFYIRKVLVSTKKIVEESLNHVEFKNFQNNSKMINKFLSMLSPGDENIERILSTEEQIMKNNRNYYEKFLHYVISILNLAGDKTMRFSDEGVAEITVNSGLAVYTYKIPAQSK